MTRWWPQRKTFRRTIDNRERGAWLCFREHWTGCGTEATEYYLSPKAHHHLESWLLCQLVHTCDSGFEPGVIRTLFWLGFIDADKDGGVMFWRWDPWNACSRTWWPRSTWRPW